MRWGMMIELDKCVGCEACVTSCKERWDSGPGAARSWVKSFTYGERGKNLGLVFYPGLCNQCTDHPCTEDCPTGATYVDAHGIVVVDPDVCIGCGNCVPKCPYGARHVDESQGIVEKCNLCAPYVARGEQPACVATCLGGARHFGDLDDPRSEISQLIATRDARPLVTQEVNVGPHVYYAPEAMRLQVLAQGVVRQPESTLFTRAWKSVTRPLAQRAATPLVFLAGVAGLAVNLRQRRAGIGAAAEAGAKHATLPRHRTGMRVLHWYNLLTWILLTITGTALMATPAFALFSTGLSAKVSALFGGHDNLIFFHVVWGLTWAVVTVPAFLYFKRGGIEALRELAPTYDDVRWLVHKPLAMLGLSHEPLPPQDKYNFGQKLFAASALAGTAAIIVTGVIMTFHLGGPATVRAAIMVHKLAVMLGLVGVSVHVTMAAVMVEERPALWSMINGTIDEEHARQHSTKWVEKLERDHQASTSTPRGNET